jgi:hypothetical protein
MMLVLASVTAVLASAVVAVGANAAEPAPGPRTERVITPVNPDPAVTKSIVEVYSPLPQSTGAHPAACDYARYVRYRHANGPARSADADSILSVLPGMAGGADEYEPNARNTIKSSAAKGRYVEYWVLTYRSECLNDRTGLDAAVAARDYRVAFDYYYKNKPVNGKRFAGWPTWRDESWLATVGVAQTMNDWRTIITEGVPDPAQRAKKVFCGGHSLGGLTTGVFSAWDYDGDRATTDDAAYNLCAGWFALDSYVIQDPAGVSRLPLVSDAVGGLNLASAQVLELLGRLGFHPSIDLKVIMTAQTWNMAAIIAMAAYFEPDAESTLLRDFARTLSTPLGTLNIQLTLRAFFSTTYTQFVTGLPPVQAFRYTNEALLGAMWDNNTGPLAIGHLGLGSLAGGPLVEKTFAAPELVNYLPIAGPVIRGGGSGEDKVGPASLTKLYTWQNYDEPAQPRWDGKVISTPANEVTDIREFAPLLFDGPTSYLDSFFPTRAIVDLFDLAGARTGDLSHVLYDHAAATKPMLIVLAGDGPSLPTARLLNPITAYLNPEDPPVLPADAVIAPEYHHQSVLAGAAKQNNGRPEIVSTALTEFMYQNTVR